MSKYLVTGGAGFIGSHLVDRLIASGGSVAVVDNVSTGRIENINPKAVFYKADICDPEIGAIFEKEKPLAVFHLAAQISVRESAADPQKDAQTNILGSLNVIKNFLLVNQERLDAPEVKFIFSSTGGAMYGDAQTLPAPETTSELPLSPYGVAKLAVEKYLYYYCQAYGMPCVSLRYANVYGPRQNSKGEAGVVAIFCDKFLAGIAPVITGDGSQTRDFVNVEDVVEANMLAAKVECFGSFNIGTGVETDINRIFELLNDLSEKKLKKSYIPALAGEQKRSCLDNSLAAQKLGWKPRVKLRDGLAQTFNWFASNRQA